MNSQQVMTYTRIGIHPAADLTARTNFPQTIHFMHYCKFKVQSAYDNIFLVLLKPLKHETQNMVTF